MARRQILRYFDFNTYYAMHSRSKRLSEILTKWIQLIKFNSRADKNPRTGNAANKWYEIMNYGEGVLLTIVYWSMGHLESS